MYDYPPPDECHGIQSLPLANSPLDYSWRVEKWFTKQRDKIFDRIDDDLHALLG